MLEISTFLNVYVLLDKQLGFESFMDLALKKTKTIMMKKTLLSAFLIVAAGLAFAQEKAKMILPPNAPFHKEFGYSISMTHNDQMVVGAEFEEGTGAVYLFDHDDFKKKIAVNSFDEDGRSFGKRSVITQNWLAVAAPGSDGDAGYSVGKIYMFFDPTYQSNFDDEPTFVIEGDIEGARLGYELEMENGWLITKSYSSNTLYVYQASGWGVHSRWDLKSTVTSPNNARIIDYAMSDNKLVFTVEGDYWEETTGDLFVYERDWQGNYTQVYQRNPASNSSWATFRYGKSVDISYSTIIVSDENAKKAEVLVGGGNYYNVADTIEIEGAYTFGEHVKVKNHRAMISYQSETGRNIGLFTHEGGKYTFKNNLDYGHNKIDNSQAQHVITFGENDMIGMAIKDSPNPGVQYSDRGAAYVGQFSKLISTPENSYEGNNSTSEAASIQIDRTYSSAISYNGDEDYYRLDWAGGLISILVESETGGNTMNLYNEDGSSRMGASHPYVGSTAGLTSGHLDAGIYYVKVSGIVGTYHLTATSLHCDTYSGEPNNTLETANFFNQNGPFGRNISGAISYSGDEDWFEFDKTANGGANLQIDLTEVAGDYDMYLYDENNALISYSVAWGTSDEQIIVENIPEGKYFLRVRGWNGANSPDCYNLVIAFPYIPSARIARTEDKSSAKLIEELGETAIISPNPANGGDVITLETSNEFESDLVEILDLSGRLITSFQAGAKGGSLQFTLPDLEPGTYMVRSNNTLTRLIVE